RPEAKAAKRAAGLEKRAGGVDEHGDPVDRGHRARDRFDAERNGVQARLRREIGKARRVPPREQRPMASPQGLLANQLACGPIAPDQPPPGIPVLPFPPSSPLSASFMSMNPCLVAPSSALRKSGTSRPENASPCAKRTPPDLGSSLK